MERMGLVSQVVPDSWLMDESLRMAGEIASKSPFAVELAKEAVNRALETTLQQGLDVRGGTSTSQLASDDGREGMKAFLEKRKPTWSSKI